MLKPSFSARAPWYAKLRLSSEPSSGCGQRVEHDLKIERRSTDHLEDVGGSGLLRKRLGQVVGAFLHLFKQPYVFNRDNRLVGKSPDERNLVFGEGFNLGTANGNHADPVVLPQQRHRERRMKAKTSRHLIRDGKFASILRVFNLNRSAVDESAPRNSIARDGPIEKIDWYGTMVRGNRQFAASLQEND